MPKKVNRPCLCGCGQQTKGGYVLPGHDKRFHDNPKAADIATLLDVAEWMVAHPKPVKVKAPKNPEKQRGCDPTCEYSIGEVCSCKCGGVNHGRGWAPFRELVAMGSAGKATKQEIRAEAKKVLRAHDEATELELEEEMA